MQIRTDLGTTQGSPDAKRIAFQPVTPLTATNIEDAINQVQANTGSATAPPTITATAVNFAASPYAPLSSDYLLEVDTAGGVVQINLAGLLAGRAGKPLEIKDATGHALANNIQLTGVTIEGQTPYLIEADYGSVTIRPNKAGTAWEVVSW